jgi:hypothetical protein
MPVLLSWEELPVLSCNRPSGEQDVRTQEDLDREQPRSLPFRHPETEKLARLEFIHNFLKIYQRL